MNKNITEGLLALALRRLREDVEYLKDNPSRGLRGPQGAPGRDGRDIISDISINEQGNLIISLNDGTDVDAGNIIGPQGPEGPRGRDTITDMFINAKDELIIELNDGSRHIIDGIKGPQGEQGPRGERGFIGEQGPAGPIGPQGIPGETGVRGSRGATGPAGPAGPQGPAGRDGKDAPDVTPLLQKAQSDYQRFVANVNKSLASIGGGGLGERDVLQLIRENAVTVVDSSGNTIIQGLDSDGVIALIQEHDVFRDSAFITNIVDSNYINARVDPSVDSSSVINLIDSDYIQARQLLATPAEGIDSAAVISLIDSAYVQARVVTQPQATDQVAAIDFGSFISPSPSLTMDFGAL